MSREEVFEQVYDIVRQISRGNVATYGEVAAILGINPRYVGYILHHNPYPVEVPCHRVVNSAGRVATTFAFGGGDAQQKLLEQEGVFFANKRLDIQRYRYRF